jgi:hypothetical protein
MAWTESDLTAIETAIAAVIAGERPKSIKMGDKEIEFADVTLPGLTRLRDQISASISTGGAFNLVEFNDPS